MIPAALLPRAQTACALAIATWGNEPQLRIAQEEFAEAIAAINRMMRLRPEGFEQAVEETADVILCALQLRIMLGADVDRKIEEKLGRLEKRVADANEPKLPKAKCPACQRDAPDGILHEKGCYLA